MTPKDILVVRPGALGDTVLTLPIIASVAAQFPRGRITFLGTRQYADLIPPAVRFQEVDSRKWTWLFGEDLEPESGQDGPYDIAFVILKRPATVIANLERTGTHSVRSATSSVPPGLHAVEYLHQALGLGLPPKAPSLPHLATRHRQDIIWIHPGSGGPTKCAPLELFVTLAHELRLATGWEIVVTAGEDDAFLKNHSHWNRLAHMPGTTVMENLPLKRLCENLGGAGLFVGNDSGISHLAAGLGVPAAVLFVATDPAQWAPWADPERLCTVDLRSTSPSGSRVKTLIGELERLACVR